MHTATENLTTMWMDNSDLTARENVMQKNRLGYHRNLNRFVEMVQPYTLHKEYWELWLHLAHTVGRMYTRIIYLIVQIFHREIWHDDDNQME